jgi:chromosome segregation ATPase
MNRRTIIPTRASINVRSAKSERDDGMPTSFHLRIPHALLAVLTGAAIAIAGCTLEPRKAHPAPDSTPASTMSADQAAIAAHLSELEQKISALEKRLGHGHGALKAGPTLLVDGGGQESVLERLRRLEKELAGAKANYVAKTSETDLLRDRLTIANTRSDGLAAQSDSLSRVRDDLVTAQQELAERKAIIVKLDEQLAATELQRLRVEQRYYTVAAGLLRLPAGQSQELIDLQTQVRKQVKEVEQ